MSESRETWGEYSKLVLKELERLNESTENLRKDMDTRFSELNQKITEVKNIEGKVTAQANWIEKVNDVWSPTQMKEAKDEIYKQKTRWAATIAIITFIQVAVGIAIAVWGKLN
jgi:DNA repair exonuclease SbcCD ATPase subunit